MHKSIETIEQEKKQIPQFFPPFRFRSRKNPSKLPLLDNIYRIRTREPIVLVEKLPRFETIATIPADKNSHNNGQHPSSILILIGSVEGIKEDSSLSLKPIGLRIVRRVVRGWCLDISSIFIKFCPHGVEPWQPRSLFVHEGRMFDPTRWISKFSKFSIPLLASYLKKRGKSVTNFVLLCSVVKRRVFDVNWIEISKSDIL